MITKERYVLDRVEFYAEDAKKNNHDILPDTLMILIEQWKFDYEVGKWYLNGVL